MKNNKKVIIGVGAALGIPVGVIFSSLLGLTGAYMMIAVVSSSISGGISSAFTVVADKFVKEK